MSNNNISQQVKDAQKQLQAKRTEQAELVGQRKTLMERLHTEFGLDTLDQAEDRIDELDEKIKTDREKLNGMVEELDIKMGEIG